MEPIERDFLAIREASKRNEDILGFVVTGSRGKGFENQWTDTANILIGLWPASL